MPKKTKEKALSFTFPFVADERQELLVSFLESNGFDIKNVKAREAHGDIQISCSRAAPICLCCLAPLLDADLKESNQLCRYCSAGDCEVESSKLKFEVGHGNLQKTLHAAIVEEEEEITDDDIESDEDSLDDEDGSDEGDED
jgi:hypothetical protein